MDEQMDAMMDEQMDVIMPREGGRVENNLS